MATDTTPAPGFAEPVFAAQRMFRAALMALAHPGRIVSVDLALEAPAPLDVATTALGLALLDHETALWLDGKLQGAEAYFRFHCGNHVAASPGGAQFAMLADLHALPPLADFRQGSDEYPDESATLILQVDELAGDGPLQLSGPGIAGVTRLGIAGLDARFWLDWPANNAAFPRGVDVFFTCGSRLCGLPRTTTVRS
jgi:alpha-D-ribose 1-methylphosphonate 5-triphosphate synthase subunit PhnH